MSKINIKQVLIYIAVIAASFATSFFFFQSLKNSDYIEPPHHESEELQSVKAQLRQQSDDITQLVDAISKQRNQEVYQDRYSKLILTILDLNNQLFLNIQPNIKHHIETILELSSNDSIILKNIEPIQNTEEIHSIKYFINNFNRLSRVVISNQEYDNSSKLLQFLHKNIYPHFAYLGDSSQTAITLNKARVYLENYNFNKFKEELDKIDNNQQYFVEYKEEFEEFLKVWNAISDTQSYIKKLVYTTNITQNIENTNQSIEKSNI